MTGLARPQATAHFSNQTTACYLIKDNARPDTHSIVEIDHILV
jgi:hypothetical protein